jgi:hypothetical protein
LYEAAPKVKTASPYIVCGLLECRRGTSRFKEIPARFPSMVTLAKIGIPSLVALALFAQMRIENVCVVFILPEFLGNRIGHLQDGYF